MVIQASFADPVTRKAKEWSPIDRMLANKRLSATKGSPARRSNQTVMDPLPRLDQRSPTPPSRTTSVGCQSISWAVLLSEAIAPERARVKALEAELKALRAQHGALVKDREESTALQEAEEAGAALAAELEALRQRHEEALARHDAERSAHDEERQQFQIERQQFQQDREQWQEERANLLREASSASGAEKRCVEDLEHLRKELRCCKENSADLRRKYAALQEESEALTRERDHLLQRLEVEQAEMIARVDALQQRMSGSGKVRVR